MAKTVVGLFDDFEDARKAVRELLENGFLKENISVAAKDMDDAYLAYAVGQSPGPAKKAFAGLGLTSQIIPGIGTALAAGPLLDRQHPNHLVNALKIAGVPADRAQYYTEGVRRGGNLVVVLAKDNMAVRAVQIVNRFGPVDLDRRAAHWRETGWQRFDSHAIPFSPADIEIERERARHYNDRIGSVSV